MSITSVGGDGREYVLVVEQSNRPVEPGEAVQGFRGVYVIDGGRAPQHSGSTGRVWTDQGEFFPSVAGCRWVLKS